MQNLQKIKMRGKKKALDHNFTFLFQIFLQSVYICA